MRSLTIIGIGAGDPEHVTVQAVRALEVADVVFLTKAPNQTEPVDTYMMFGDVERPYMELSSDARAELERLQQRHGAGWLRKGEAVVARQQRGRTAYTDNMRNLAA